MSKPSFVVTGGAQGVGRAIAERLATQRYVLVLDIANELDWDNSSVELVSGDASDPVIAAHAAEQAESAGQLTGWVNNAAIFGDASMGSASAEDVLGLITANLALALTGCHTAINHYLRAGRPGAIVNVSSHQAQRPVRGALPYGHCQGRDRRAHPGYRGRPRAGRYPYQCRRARLHHHCPLRGPPHKASRDRRPNGRIAPSRPSRHQQRGRRGRDLPPLTPGRLRQRRHPPR